jgi:hypothetical protein
MNFLVKYTSLIFITTTLVACGGGSDESQPKPLPVEVKADFDKDGISDDIDTDDDNDGVLDIDDAFPLDSKESVDTDRDGIGNNADPDDDNDGVLDIDDAFPLDSKESVDTDGDGIGNNADPDDDNDAVLDADDAFPLDASESVDTDGDGIGNNADPDDDNDAVLDADDAFPLDSSESVDSDGDGVGNNADVLAQNPHCYLAADVSAGRCYVEIIGEMTNAKLIATKETTVYFFLPTTKKLLPYDVQSKHFGAPISIGQADSGPTQVIYHQLQDKFYLAYGNGLVTTLANQAGATEAIFANLNSGILAIASFDNFVLINGGYLSRIYSADGQYHENSSYLRDARDIVWNPSNDRLYFLTQSYSPRDIYYAAFDKSSGQITATVDSPYHGAYQISGPLALSPNGQQVLLGSGDVYNSSDLTLADSIGMASSYIRWLSDTQVLALKTQDGQTLVRRIDTSSSQVLEQFTLQGDLLATTQLDTQTYISYRRNGIAYVHNFVVNDDSDADGVTNTQDAFPNDAAAALDSDFDGYPDAWLDGKTQANSTTGLILDAFPQDSACYLASQGSAGQCDIASRVPNFTPDKIIQDDSGIVYLLDGANGRIYRWSATSQSYLNPLVVGIHDGFNRLTPTTVALSNTHARLYLGYASGAITKLELTGQQQESPFAIVPTSVGGLSEAGQFMLAQDSSGAWNTHYTFDIDGHRHESKDWNQYSTQFAWNSANQRLYFYRDDTSPNDLHYEQIDQQTGLIVSQGETPYHGDYRFSGAITISPTGDRVLIGSGEVFDANAMTHLASLNQSHTNAVWVNNVIVTLTSTTEQHSLAIYDNDGYQLAGTLNFNGTALAMLPQGEDVLVVQKNAQGLSFTTRIIGDHDADGLPGWWEQLYQLDDQDPSDASQDMDQDGLTELEEFIAHTLPNDPDTDNDGLTDGEELNNYHTDPLVADSDQDGLSDGVEVNTYGTNPLQADSDGDGITDTDEVERYATNPLAGDSDNDGLDDLWEVSNATDPNSNDSQLDPDGDGLVNIDELTYHSNPQIADTDSDGLTDGAEVHTHLTDPVNKDTDGDFMSDGWEIRFALAPLVSQDANDDLDGDSYSNLEEYFLDSFPDDDTSVPQAKTWSTYQGNASHNGFVAQRISVSDLTPRWSLTSTALRGTIAVADGKLFGTSFTYDSSTNSSVASLRAMDMYDGHLVWQKQYASVDSINSPAYLDGKVYFQTGGHSNAFLRGIDANNGDLLFKSSYGNQWSTYHAPTVTQDGVYLAGGMYGGAYRFNKDSGQEEWFHTLEQEDGWTPAVRDSKVYLFKRAGLIKASTTTGETLNEISTEYSAYSAYTPVLGFVDDAYAVRNNALVAFDTEANKVSWTLTGGNYQQPAVGIAILAVINSGALNVLNSKTGQLLWAWEPDSGQSIQSNIVITPNLIFVADNVNTYAIDIQTHQRVWSYEATGSLTLSNQGALIIHNANGQISVINTSGDTDADGMPDWWEQSFGLNFRDADDATSDADGDGLNNLQEFVAGSQPNNTDSDADGLNDGDEVNIHLTRPNLADTDGDRLSDYAEIITYGTNPLVADTDNDNFSDGDEVLLYSTDPNDNTSVPAALSNYQESFEGSALAVGWSHKQGNVADWQIDASNASDGSQSMRAGGINDGQSTALSFYGLFADGVLSFDAKVSAEACCDKLLVFVDGQQVEQIQNGDWRTVQLTLTQGEHTIEWRYQKDGSVSSDQDTAWIDKVHFVQ